MGTSLTPAPSPRPETTAAVRPPTTVIASIRILQFSLLVVVRLFEEPRSDGSKRPIARKCPSCYCSVEHCSDGMLKPVSFSAHLGVTKERIRKRGSPDPGNKPEWHFPNLEPEEEW